MSSCCQNKLKPTWWCSFEVSERTGHAELISSVNVYCSVCFIMFTALKLLVVMLCDYSIQSTLICMSRCVNFHLEVACWLRVIHRRGWIVCRLNIMVLYIFLLPSVLWRCWLGGRKGIRSVKKLEWWGTGMVICLERDADLHMAQLMPLPLTVSVKSRLVLPFWYQLTWVVPEKGR